MQPNKRLSNTVSHYALKALNIVRFQRGGNRLRLVDFDATVKIIPSDNKDETFSAAKFPLAILSPRCLLLTLKRLNSNAKFCSRVFLRRPL